MNAFVNISNLDYYDIDVGDGYTSSVPPEIYPDPESVQISKKISTEDDYKPMINKNLAERNEDFKEHDTIDNIMYIYYGSVGSMRKSLGGSKWKLNIFAVVSENSTNFFTNFSGIIIVGAVFALAAQILAIVLSLLRNRYEC